MMKRHRALDAAERALWNRVAASVTPLPCVAPVRDEPPLAPLPPAQAAAPPKPVRARVHAPLVPPLRPRPRASLARASLDSHWDRRLKAGRIAPDLAVDLHGHSLASAHAALDHALRRAVRGGLRVVLVVAGRERAAAPHSPHHAPVAGQPRPRGAIRAALPDWLATSPLADRIIATRPAHTSHGGAGALYVVLCRAGEG